MFGWTRLGQWFEAGASLTLAREWALLVLVPREGESPFAFVGTFIPNVGSLVDVFFFVHIFDNVKFL